MRLGSAVAVLMFAAAPGPAPADSTPGAYLGDLSWPEAEARPDAAPLVVLAFGPGAKEHGPHLPMNADAKVAEYLCARCGGGIARRHRTADRSRLAAGFSRFPRHRGGRPHRLHKVRRLGRVP